MNLAGSRTAPGGGAGSVFRDTPRGRGTAPGGLGFGLFLASLAVFFLGALAAHVYLRYAGTGARAFPDPPLLPGVIWATLVLAAADAVLEVARRRLRRRGDVTARRLLAAELLGWSFLVLQAWNALNWLARGSGPTASPFAFTLFVLAGLHAAHVLGGIGFLVYVRRAAASGRLTWARPEPLNYAAWYWHFLGALWVVLAGVVFFAP